MNFEIQITSPASADQNMASDIGLLKSLEEKPRSILRFYKWETNSATYGYFLSPYSFLNKKETVKRKIQIARRPTGGGIIFHHGDLAFSFLLPSNHPAYSINPLDNYVFVNTTLMKAIRRFSPFVVPHLLEQNPQNFNDSRYFCMAKPTQYDVMIHGRKVGGGAQRLTKTGYLHQGSLALSLPDRQFLENLLDASVIEEMMKNSDSILEGNNTPLQIAEARQQMQFNLIQAFKEATYL